MINFRDDVLPLKNKLFRLALRITANRSEAEDIVQETFIKVWNRREEWENIYSIEAFSLTVCRNMALDRIARKESANKPLDEADAATPDLAATPLQSLAQTDEEEWVMKLFNQLPEKLRSVMQLRDIEGKSYKEIAQVLGISEDQVKVNLFRARRRIRQQFDKIEKYGL